MLLRIFYWLSISGLIVSSAEARSFRVNQIPNGSKYGCQNCHSSSFGGTRNAFGLAIENSFLDASGNVLWGSALAALDSDGDGDTNGKELQDPSGVWKIGDPNPGDLAMVSNPGDPSSWTNVQTIKAPGSFILYQNYPNPFNPETKLSFSLPYSALVNLTVYNLSGHPVRELINEVLPEGEHQMIWDGKDQTGSSVGSGFYFVRLKTADQVRTIRMLLVK